MKFNNKVIESVNKEDGVKIFNYLEAMSVDLGGRKAADCRYNGYKYNFYGVIDGVFDNYSAEKVRQCNDVVIIPMSEVENYLRNLTTGYPKQMLVLNGHAEVTIVGECTVVDGKTIYIQKNKNEYVVWCDAVDVQPIFLPFDDVARRLRIDPSRLYITNCKLHPNV